MSWPGKVIRFSFNVLFFLVPLIFLPYTSELFEFNKILVTYLFTIIIAGAWITQAVWEKRLLFHRTILDVPLHRPPHLLAWILLPLQRRSCFSCLLRHFVLGFCYPYGQTFYSLSS